MATEKRQAHPSVRDRLFREFYRFTFFQAVSILERMAQGGNGLGRELLPGMEPVRFSVQPGFAFPPSDIADLKVPEGGGQPVLEVSFLGLIGPSGVLPRWYNELALERKGRKDRALGAFLDIFQHRLLSLFYLAWKKNRLPVTYRPDGSDRFSFQLRCLIGLGGDRLFEKLGLPGNSPMYLGGVMARRVPTAAAVEALVRYHFQVSAEVEQFVPRLLTLEPEERTAVGKANSRLGVDTVCGSQLWDIQSKFCLKLGPMPFDTYVRFLPGGDRLGPLLSLVRFQGGIEYDFAVQVILQREDAPCLMLGGGIEGGSRLGWTGWIRSPGVPLDHDPHAAFEMEDLAEVVQRHRQEATRDGEVTAGRFFTSEDSRRGAGN